MSCEMYLKCGVCIPPIDDQLPMIPTPGSNGPYQRPSRSDFGESNLCLHYHHSRRKRVPSAFRISQRHVSQPQLDVSGCQSSLLHLLGRTVLGKTRKCELPMAIAACAKSQAGATFSCISDVPTKGHCCRHGRILQPLALCQRTSTCGTIGINMSPVVQCKKPLLLFILQWCGPCHGEPHPWWPSQAIYVRP